MKINVPERIVTFTLEYEDDESRTEAGLLPGWFVYGDPEDDTQPGFYVGADPELENGVDTMDEAIKLAQKWASDRGLKCHTPHVVLVVTKDA